MYYQNVSRCNANKTHRAIPRGVKCIVQSALKRAEMVSTLLMPGHTLTATMFDFWTVVLTTGTEDEPSGLGNCAAGSASRMCCRCRVTMMLHSERMPSFKKTDLSFGGSKRGKRVAVAA
jgi:hypothetical protein